MYKQTSNVKFAILNFIKNLVSTSVYNDVKKLLNPCCIPSVIYGEPDCFNSGSYPVTGVSFPDSTITAVAFKNQTVTVVATSPDSDGGIIQEITLDANGVWEGTLYSSWYAYADGDITVILSILGQNSQVLVSGETQILTIPNCD